MLEAESTPEPQYGRKDHVKKNSNGTIGNWTRDHPTCTTVPQPTTPPRDPVLMDLTKVYINVGTRREKCLYFFHILNKIWMGQINCFL
jgi:hypothetical protein